MIRLLGKKPRRFREKVSVAIKKKSYNNFDRHCCSTASNIKWRVKTFSLLLKNLPPQRHAVVLISAYENWHVFAVSTSNILECVCTFKLEQRFR